MTSRFRFAAPTFATLLFALLLFAAWVRPFADLDFAWQVRTGEQILQTGSLHVEDQSDLQATLTDYPVFNGHLSLSGRSALELDWPRFAGKALVSVRTDELTLDPVERVLVANGGENVWSKT